MFFHPNKRPFVKWSLLSALSGLLAGIAAWIFLVTLDAATHFRDENLLIVWLLPLGGFAIGWIYHRFGKDIAAGNNLILEEIHDPKRTVPIIMAPFILVGTVVTHLFGGSAGREGTAVQMGASLSDQLSKVFKIEPEERRILLVCGAGAGFGAAIGTPWAGILFGMEVIQIGRLRLFALVECAIASFCAYYTTVLLGAPHSRYPKPFVGGFDFKTLLWIAAAGVLFGLVAQLFSRIVHVIEHVERKHISYAPLKPFIAGLVLVVLYWWEGSYRYVGLGIPVIQESLEHVASWRDPVFKFLFTAITVASGFKGGEFIPLVFIGSTLGSALSAFVPVSPGLLGAVGFAAIFGAASNTPLSCTIMAMELFGVEVGAYTFVACYLAYYFSGHHGIYRSQIVADHKHRKLRRWIGWLGELPRRFFNGGKW